MDYHQPAPKNQQHKNIAFVLGNGRSRLRANLDELKKYGTIYGCNGLYREFEPDYLIAVDVKMVREIVATGWHLKHQLWTNPNKDVLNEQGVNFFNPHKGWSSGPTALWMATLHQHTSIYFIGFDFQGIGEQFNNVYADTPNYKRSSEPATYFGNWSNQTERVIRENPKVIFNRVSEPGAFIPANIGDISTNLRQISFEQLNEDFPGAIFK